ncbi:MAG: hypothetical protein IKB88_04990 [Clostridia bacterium]|nr:hypothetical protein [Clostridia bacterium]
MKKFITVLAFVVAISVLFTGCPPPPGITPHQSEKDLISAINALSEKAGSTKANLYFDNTMSMYGYVCESVTPNTPLVKSNFTIVCNALADVIKGYNSFALYSLDGEPVDGSETEYLKWTDTDPFEFSKFISKDFYTFDNTSHKGSFNRDKGETGPLQMLFNSKESPVNFDELNVFVTDLAEQDLNNKLLAERISDIVLDREDHSVALFCVKSNFMGYASVPASGITDRGHVEMINNDNFVGERPFYCVIVGPTIEVVALCDSLTNTFKDSGLAENRDFFSAKVLSKRGLQYSPITNAESLVFDNIYIDEENSDHDYGEYPGFTYSNSNLNFNVEKVHYEDIYGPVSEKYYGLYYQFNPDDLGSLDNSTKGKAVINFALPLSSLSDGTAAENVKYTLTRDMIKVYGWKQVEVSSTDEHGIEESETLWQWVEISNHDLFDSNDKYMELPVCELLNNGDSLERATDFATNEELRSEDNEYPREKLKFYTVDNENGALRVRLEFNNLDKLVEDNDFTYLTVAFNIDATKTLDTNIPDWINEFNLMDSEVPSPDNANIYQKTAGLLSFYKFLIGERSSSSERAEFEKQMTKNVSDVVVAVKLEY